MDFSQVEVFLNHLQMHKIKLGLDAMRLFLKKVDNPEKKLSFVHLAGTNGKGTVCAALLEILHRSHYKVGVYTSPHLNSVRERFRVGRGYINEDDFARIGSRIIEVLAGEKITYFEFTTALALLWFAEQKVDLAVFETGMGGRLDATNVILPLICVITNISMDHQPWLGDSLKEIAVEKAGIIKRGVPVISGVTGDAATVISEKTQEFAAPLYRLGHEFDYTITENTGWNWDGGKAFGKTLSGLVSRSVSVAQQENESLALAALSLLEAYGFRVADAQIRNGLSALLWPGRMELLQVIYKGKKIRVLLDGAHNSAGVKNLAETLTKSFPERRHIIWGSMVDKDVTLMLRYITPLFDTLILTRPEGERSASPETLLSALAIASQRHVICEPDCSRALNLAVEYAEEDDLIVVGGSLYLVGAVRLLLCGKVV